MIPDLPERLEAIADHLDDWDHPITGRQDCREAARELRRLRAEIADRDEHHQRVVDSPCRDERHCTCVPILRVEIERLKAIVSALVPVYWAAEAFITICHADPSRTATKHRDKQERILAREIGMAREPLAGRLRPKDGGR